MFTTQSLIFRRFAIIQSASVRLSSIKQNLGKFLFLFWASFWFQHFFKNFQLSLKFNLRFSFLIKWIKVSKAHMEGMGTSLLRVSIQKCTLLQKFRNKLKICSILLHYLDSLSHFSNGDTFVCRYMGFFKKLIRFHEKLKC